MAIRLSEDKKLVQEIREKLKENGGYCPCKIERTEDTKCMCKEFREQKSGECHCGLYIKNDDDKIVINDYIENDPLSEENLDNTLNLVNEFRLSFGDTKTIWLYTGYETIGISDDLWVLEPNITTDKILEPNMLKKEICNSIKRSNIIKQCNILVDGLYIDSQRDVTLRWCGSSNQKVIDIKQSLQKGEVILWDT